MDFLCSVSERAKTCVLTGLAESPCLQLCPDEHTDGTPRKSQILCVSGRAELVSIRDLQKVLICDSLNAHPDRLVLKLMSDDFGSFFLFSLSLSLMETLSLS
jgi:hypothetical protein